MKEAPGFSRRKFFQKTATLAAAGVAGNLIKPQRASAKVGTLATVIDISRCDGCCGEGMPLCVAACREKNKVRFPEPQKPIRDLWPHKFHDDWSDRREIMNRLTPYNWTFVQKVTVQGRELHLPRRCMHCHNAPCVNLCPFGALSKERNSAVVINDRLCMGGAKCLAVCPWEIPQRQSGVGLYLKIQPLPAGGGVMYKCDLCHDLLQAGQTPACIAACEKRLGNSRPLFIGPRAQMESLAKARADQIGGFIYGQGENGGTATWYVSPVDFAKITEELKAESKKPLLLPVSPRLDETNRWAWGFIAAPLAAAVGAVMLARKEKMKLKGEGDGTDNS